MPGLVRKVLITAGVNGLILHSHADHHKSILVEYNSKKIRECSQQDTVQSRKDGTLESHGVVGLFSIASYAFLIAVTRREQVAQIFNKQVYVITDVAVLPVSNQAEAVKAIRAAIDSQRARSPESDSEMSDTDTEFDRRSAADSTDELGTTPSDHPSIFPRKNSNATSSGIAEEVLTKKGQVGSAASQWFSKQGWRFGKGPAQPPFAQPSNASPLKDSIEPSSVVDKSAPLGQATGDDVSTPVPALATTTSGEVEGRKSTDSTRYRREAVREMIPKIVNTTKLMLASRNFFFSYDLDLTRRLGSSKTMDQPPSIDSMDSLFFWNRNIGRPLFEAGQHSFLLPVIQGFIGQRSFVAQKPHPKDEDRSASVIPIQETEVTDPHDQTSTAISTAETVTRVEGKDTEAFLLTLISRRSLKRPGLRYLRRGIDDQGNCANTVETEQILSSADWDKSKSIRSFVQIRASIPLYFTQSAYSFKPVPVLQHSMSANEAALKKHFQTLKTKYGNVQIAVLVDKHGGEQKIGDAFEKTVKDLTESKQLEGIEFDWFDFHAECRGMKFENVDRLVRKMENTLTEMGETVSSLQGISKKQTGIMRTNCMDCLDRTNVAQSAFAQWKLQTHLREDGFDIDLVNDQSTTWFNTLWADNGDAISRQYASTAALKSDYTRTRVRSYKGAITDLSLTLNRYYNNMINDYFSQAVIDVLLGNVSWSVFEDFESNMSSIDPGISIEKIRQSAIENCRRLVVQNVHEDLIHGWTMLVPAQENTLRTLPFEEAVVLLTDTFLYCCKFDWTTEKVASFEKVDIQSITKIRYGTYVTSVLTERQTEKDLNAGLVIVYEPSIHNIARTNTRSLQNFVDPEKPSSKKKTKNAPTNVDDGLGMFSWMTPRAQYQILALKVIPATAATESGKTTQSVPLALNTAEHIAGEIRRAITGGIHSENAPGELEVEEGDIISLEEAKQRTGYLEQIGHSLRKLVWA